MLMMVVAVTAALLACTKDGRENENDDVEIEPQYVGADTMTLRVVGDASDGTLILAGETEIYTLPLDGVTLYLDGSSVSAAEIESGMAAEVWYTGGVQETYPAKFSQVVAVSLSREDDARYDLCGLYLQVLEDLWAADPGLNEGVTQVGLDLSGLTGLTQGEKAAVAWAFGETHGLEVVTGTLEELWTQGYFTPMTEPAEGYEDSLALYQWEDGVHFTLTTDTEAAWNLPALGPGEESPVLTAFDAQKWRSGLGAYFFSDCTAQRGADGTWTYTVGSEAIA